jgi:hypothetical protein
MSASFGFASLWAASSDELPREWLVGLQTASEAGFTGFSESPYLKDRRLPPVDERLPPDPLVAVPLHDLGQYGGTARVDAQDMQGRRSDREET